MAPMGNAAAFPEHLAEGNSTAQVHWCTARSPDVSLRGAKRRGNLAESERITGNFRRKRSCLHEIATAPSGPRNDTSSSAKVHQRPYAVEWPRTRRSLTAATGPVGGWFHFNDSPYRSLLYRRARLSAPLHKRTPGAVQLRECFYRYRFSHSRRGTALSAVSYTAS